MLPSAGCHVWQQLKDKLIDTPQTRRSFEKREYNSEPPNQDFTLSAKQELAPTKKTQKRVNKVILRKTRCYPNSLHAHTLCI